MPRCAAHDAALLTGTANGRPCLACAYGCVVPLEPRPVLPRIENRSTVKASLKIPGLDPGRPQRQASCPHEHAEQVALMRQVKRHQRDHWELGLLYAVPNGGARFKATAAALQDEGVQAGVPDLCLPVPAGGHHGLWIELKRERGGRVEPAQHERLDTLAWLGYR